MKTIELRTVISAPKERCFKLTTSIDLHIISTTETKEQAIEGVTKGLIKLNETVTWSAKHFGIWHKMKIKITAYNKPDFFVDEMVKGPFKFMRHEHQFESIKEGTLMKDKFEFASPMGILGKLVDELILENYMKKFLIARNKTIKEFAETEKWKQVLGN